MLEYQEVCLMEVMEMDMGQMVVELCEVLNGAITFDHNLSVSVIYERGD